MRKINGVIFFAFISIIANAQFSFVHITDLHVSDASSFVNGCDLNGDGAHCYLKEFSKLTPKPAFVAATGDVSNIGDNIAYGMYPSLTQYLYPGLVLNPGIGAYHIDSTETIPIYFTPGNHDYYASITPPQSSTLIYYEKYVAPDTDYAVKNTIAVIIFLRSGYDSDRPIWQDPNITNPEGSGISNAQCHWLRNVLSANGTKRKIIVMHHPPVNVAGTNSDGSPYTAMIWDTADGSILNNRTTFLNICDSNHVDVVLAGHVHQNVVASRSGKVVNENWPDSTRYVQTGSALNQSYRIITVNQSFVSVSPPLLSCISQDVSELSDQMDISVFPNPTSGKFNVSISQLADLKMNNIEIYNVLGECVHRQIATSANLQIDLSEAPNGIYFLQIKTADGVEVKKIVKE
jgi:3',5'-cyclic AMP phosphodiesterase CpdA